MTPPRRTLSMIQHYPTPQEIYSKLATRTGWQYKTNIPFYLCRDRSLPALLYLGDFRISEVLPLTLENFETKLTYIWVKDVLVSKKRKPEYREAKLPLQGPRRPLTELISDYLKMLKPSQRLYSWSLEKKIFQLPKKHDYTVKSTGETKHRYSSQIVGTHRAWQIVNALLPEYTQHFMRAFGYNFDYDHMQHDVLAVSDKTKADPRSLQPYLRRRYEKYPVV